MEKYSLVKDSLGIRMGKYVENWKKLTTELEKGRVYLERDSRHFLRPNS